MLPGQMPSVPENFESRLAALQGSGRPLPASERAFFEPRFGRDFSNVLQRKRPRPETGSVPEGTGPGDVGAPATRPSLAAVPEVLPLDSCGRVIPRMDPANARSIRDCVTHARFVNLMNQSIANMAQVASPYAPGLAAVYQAAFAEVVKAGLSNPPTDTAPRTFTATNLNVMVSPGITLPILSFELKLLHDPKGPNGAKNETGIELNEVSQAAMLEDQPGIERTMYHEGFHWLSGKVTSHNRSVRQGLADGAVVREELDDEFVRPFEIELRAAAEPLWKDILAAVPLQPSEQRAQTPQDLSGYQWIKVKNEILSRVEEAVYLNLRQGRGFSQGIDLPALPQDWLLEGPYWDAGGFFEPGGLRSFLTANADRVKHEMLPVVQKIQGEYLRRRARP